MTGPNPVSGEPLLEFVQVMEQLRAECSWKREQTHRSLARYLLEETHEVLEAIDTGDLGHLREELGDLLLQVYFHAIIAAESGAFTIDDVAADVVAKMRRRNPHVFGDAASGDAQTLDAQTLDAQTLDAQTINELWESIKAQEKQRVTVDEGLPPGLPALLYADKVLDRLARAGRPVEPAGDELGDRLLAMVAEARADGVDPEQALRDAVRRLLKS
jgi:XTP/dITP diphosphohydrolase